MKAPAVALVASGPTKPEILARLPLLARRLGLVKAPTYQQASRVCTAIGAGVAVPGWAELGSAPLLLVTVPDVERASVAAGLIAMERSWDGALVMFAGSPGVPAGLEEKGIKTASITPLNESGRAHYLGAGDIRAASMVRSAGGKATVVAAVDAAAYRGALRLSREGLPSLVESSAASLRSAGLPIADARALVENEAEAALRLYFRTRRRPEIHEKLAGYAELVSRDDVP